jgi:arabinose operon protein AraL
VEAGRPTGSSAGRGAVDAATSAAPRLVLRHLPAWDEGTVKPRGGADRGITGIVLDLDGTICVGDRLIEGAAEALRGLRRMGYRATFVSNSIDGRETYAERLERYGVSFDLDDILTATEALRLYLQDHAPGATLYAIADPPLRETLKAEFTFSDDPQRIDVVIASADRSFDFAKLNIAFQALKRGARFVATNSDATAPTQDGEIPDAGAVIGALEACSKRQVEQIVGKPSAFMAERALERLGSSPGQTLMVGDRIETDVVMGQQAGMITALVLTGVSRPEIIAKSPIQPDFILQSVRQLPALLELLR